MKGEKNFYFSSAISSFVELHSKIEVTAEEVRENVGRNEMKWNEKRLDVHFDWSK